MTTRKGVLPTDADLNDYGTNDDHGVWAGRATNVLNAPPAGNVAAVFEVWVGAQANGVVQRWSTDEASWWREKVDSTGTFTQRSYRHGAWIDRAFYPARIMAITGRFIAPHAGARDEQYAVLEAAADRLLGSIPLDDPAEVVVTAGGRTRMVRARQDGPQVARVNPPGTWGEFSIQLVAPDPRRLSAGAERSGSTGLPSTEGGLVIPGRWIV